MAVLWNVAEIPGRNLDLPVTRGAFPIHPSRASFSRVRCTPVPQQVDSGILCEPCGGKGWLLCDFCKGQKTNVQSATTKIYRRCPSCRAMGYVVCWKCKVFKCVTYPNAYDDDKKPSL